MATATIKTSGLGFFSILTLIFITLKLTGHIEWSWLWVLAPIWISASIVLALFLLVLLLFILDEQKKNKNRLQAYNKRGLYR